MSKNPDVHKLVTHPTAKQPGSELTRKIWTSLNRIRTGHDRSGHMMFKWGIRDSAEFDCGHESQTTNYV